MSLIKCPADSTLSAREFIRQVIQGWLGRPDRAIRPAALSPFNGRNADRILCCFLFINIDTETRLIIRPQITIVQFGNTRKNFLKWLTKINHFLNTKIMASQIKMQVGGMPYR